MTAPITGPVPGRTATILEAEVDNCDAEVYLNGVPLALLLSSRNRGAAVPVMQQLVQGDNCLTLAVNPGATPGNALAGDDWTAPHEARAVARLVTYPLGVFPGDPSGLEHGALRWSGDGLEAGTRRVEGLMDWGDMWPVPAGPWAWESAPVLDLDTTRGAVEAFIARVHAALADGDTDFMLRLTDRYIRELAVAYSLDPGQELKKSADLFSGQFAEPGWAMEPLEPDEHDLRLCAGGRLVECVRADREPILCGVPDADGGQYMFPMMVGAVGGQLRLLG